MTPPTPPDIWSAFPLEPYAGELADVLADGCAGPEIARLVELRLAVRSDLRARADIDRLLAQLMDRDGGDAVALIRLVRVMDALAERVSGQARSGRSSG